MDMSKWKFESVKKKRTLLKSTLITQENKDKTTRKQALLLPQEELCGSLK